MESQPLEQPAQEPSRRPQSNAISRYSRAERSRFWNPFLSFTLLLGFSSWVVSLVSQALFAARSGENATIRLLWFGIVIQFILLFEILEVVISGMFTYGVQISIFAGLATVFAVLGVDLNIYALNPIQKAIGAGWLITAIIDLLWIIYFTSPDDSPFIGLTTLLSFPRRVNSPTAVEKVSKSQDAFVMSPQNGSTNAGPGAEALIGLGLDADEYATLAAVDIDKLKEERIHGPERTSGYDLNDVELQRGIRIKSGGLWSNYTPTTPPARRTTMSSAATEGAQGAEKEGSARGSERERSVRRGSGTTGVSVPETPLQEPPRSKTPARPVGMVEQPLTPVQTQPSDEPVAQWRAEALFDYPGAADDPTELSFKKGEHLAIFDKSGKWWEAKNTAGKKGIAPSNYLRLL